MKQANATFSIKSWNRSPWGEPSSTPGSGVELFHLELKIEYHGELEGEGIIHYLLADNGDQRGGFVGLQIVTGSLSGRKGRFVFQHTGIFNNDHIADTWIVLPGSGSGALRGISGTVMVDVPNPMDSYPLSFHYEV